MRTTIAGLPARMRSVRRANASLTAGRFLRTASAVWGLVWLSAIGSTLLNDNHAMQWPVIAWGSLLVEAGVFLLLLGRRVSDIATVSIVSALVIVNACNVVPWSGNAAQLVTTSWLNITTIVTAFLLPRLRQAMAGILLIASASMCILVLRLEQAGALEGHWRLAVLAAVYSGAVGMGAAQAGAAIRGAAARTEQQAQTVAASVAREASEQARRDEVRAVARLLHDTVINTFGAIRRGVSDAGVAATRDRCRSNLEDIASWLSGATMHAPSTVEDLAEAVRSDAAQLALAANILQSTPREMRLPASVTSAARTMLREAMTNVAKHAGVSDVHVALRHTQGAFSIEVADRGRGGASAADSGGIRRSIIAPVQESGGTFRLTSPDGEGTHIMASWPLDEKVASPEEPPVVDPFDVASLRRIASRTAGWLGGLAVVEALLFHPVDSIAGTLAALSIIGLTLLSVTRGRFLPLGIASASVYAAAIVLVITLPNLDAGICRVDVPQAWGVDGAAAIVVVLALLGPRVIASVMAGVATTIGLVMPLLLTPGPSDGCVSGVLEVLPIELGTVIVVTAFRRLLERLSREAQASAAAMVDIERTSAIDESRADVRSARLREVAHAIEPILRTVADGSTDPRDSDIREAAGRAESAMRSLLLLDERLGMLGDILAGAIMRAYAAGVVVQVRSGESISDPSPVIAAQLRTVIEEVLDCVPAGADVMLGLFPRPGRSVLTIVIAQGDVAPMLSPQCDAIDVTMHRVDDETFLEVAWSP